MAKKKKVRVSFQKNRKGKTRERDLTRKYRDDQQKTELVDHGERVRAKGSHSRKRTVQVDAESDTLALEESEFLRGRVLTARGLYCTVVTDDGLSHQCYVRKLLKSLESDERAVVVAGDWVWFRPAPNGEGMIYRVEQRTHTLTRHYRRREQVIAANVEQVLIVSSLVDPALKPNLVDRYLVSAERGGIHPIICFNKVDLADGVRMQPLVGLYSQLGYTVLLTSAKQGRGIERLHDCLRGKETVVVGQSGVGKSSLLNALEPTLQLRVSNVSASTHKGRHTTTTTQLLRLKRGGTVVDTAGIRQFDLWDVNPVELDGHFIEFRPFTAHCRLPGCTHTHEDRCGIKDAVELGLISSGRYESYLRLYQGDMAG